MTRFLGLFTTANVIYILAHLCLMLLGFCLLGSSSTVAKGIGGSLVAAGLAGWVVLVYVLQSQTISDRIRMVMELGFISAFQGRSVLIKHEYDSRLASSKQQIDILGFGLKTLRQDYANHFQSWKARANVRILLIDPDYPDVQHSFADQRDVEERDRAGSIREDVEAFVTEVEPLLNENRLHTFEVKLYRCLPSVNLFRVDSEMFWGPYLIHQQSRNSPTFVVREGPLFTTLIDHFDAIWSNDSLTRSIEDYRRSHPIQANDHP